MTQTHTIDSSLRNILNVTIPIVLSALSVNLVYVIDRFMLAKYSVDAMNAAVMSGNFVAIFSFMMASITSIAEVFVGQYNGSKQYDKLAIPIWQMIYFSLASMVFFAPIAYFSEHINTLPPYYFKDGVIYQKTLMYFEFIPPIKVALAAFFIGQGRTKIVTFCIFVGSILHVMINFLLIYGVTDLIPCMGIRGAAIGSIVSEMIQVIILASLFFNKHNRKTHNTLKNRKIDPKLMLKCIKTAFPLSAGNAFTMIIWYIVQTMVSHISKDLATAYNIGINIYIMFIFIGDGFLKATATICANMIGNGDIDSIKKTYRTFIFISIIAGAMISIPLVFFPKWILFALDMFPASLSELYDTIKIILIIVTVNITLEMILCATWGVLTAGGDTKYPAIVYQLFLCLLILLPLVILRYFNMLNSAITVNLFSVASTLGSTFFIYKRYKSLKWYKKLV